MAEWHIAQEVSQLKGWCCILKPVSILTIQYSKCLLLAHRPPFIFTYGPRKGKVCAPLDMRIPGVCCRESSFSLWSSSFGGWSWASDKANVMVLSTSPRISSAAALRRCWINDLSWSIVGVLSLSGRMMGGEQGERLNPQPGDKQEPRWCPNVAASRRHVTTVRKDRILKKRIHPESRNRECFFC